MWILNNRSTFISGPMEALLKEAGFLMMRDLGYEEGLVCIHLGDDAAFDCRYNGVFSRMSIHEQVYAVHFVLDHLFDESKEAPRLRLWMESAIDMLFSRIDRSVRRACKTTNHDIRKLVIDAFRQFYPRDEMMGAALGLSRGWGEEDELPYANNAHRVQDRRFWRKITEQLRDVLIGEGDLDIVENLQDFRQESREASCKIIGIDLEGQSLPPMTRSRREVLGLLGKIAGM